MKHLKLFENNTNTFWIVAYTHDREDSNLELYPDEESADNSVIMYVNSLVKQFADVDDGYDEEDLILTLEDALDYYQEQFGEEGYSVEVQEITLNDKVELDEEIKILINKNKYNL